MKIQLQKDGIFLKLMRISITQLCLALLCVGLSYAKDSYAQELLEKRITLRAEEKSIKTILSKIESESNLKFVYSPEAIKANRITSINAQNQSLKDVLDSFLEPLQIKYRLSGNKIVLRHHKSEKKVSEANFIIQSPEGTLNADITITGKVLALDNKEGLPGVSVLIKGTQKGTTTDMNGDFSIVVPDSKTILVFSFVGYLSQEVVVGNRSLINISLAQDSKALEEVVVTALGIKRDKRALGYSIQELNGDDLSTAKEANVATTLSGKMAGVQVSRSSGGAGGSSKVIIRGNNSLVGNSQPLYVIDGIPMDNSLPSHPGTVPNAFPQGTDYGDGISNINPEDIETISVLKGPNAAALYGQRGSNGVILITTKSGKSRKGIGIKYGMDYSVGDALVLPDFQNEFGQGLDGNFTHWRGTDGKVYTMAQAKAGNIPGMPKASAGRDRFTRGSWGAKMEGQQYEDQFGNISSFTPQPNTYQYFFNKEKQLMNNISMEGGNETLNYRLAFGNTKVNGYVPNNTLDRNNVSLRTIAKLTSKLELDVKANYINQKAKNRPTVGDANDNPTYLMISQPRSIPNEVMEQSAWTAAEISKQLGYGSFLYPGLEKTYATNSSTANHFWTRDHTSNNDERNRIIGMIKLSYKFNDWIRLSAKTGLDTYTDQRFRYREKGTYNSQNRNGDIREEVSRIKEENSDILLSLTPDLSKNISLSLNLGASHQRFYNRTTGNTGLEFIAPSLFAINNTLINSYVFNLTESVINSVYGAGSLGYKDFAFVDFSIRNDWSSTLSPANNSFFYPAVSGSFLVTEAIKSLKSSSLSFLKLRASWAQAGSSGNPYQLTGNYSLDAVSHGGNPLGSFTSTIPDPNLKNELTTSIELGLEARFLKNRLGFTFAYYDASTKNQILNVPLPASSTFSFRRINAGEIRNHGIEVSLTGTPIKSASGFSWDATVNFSRNRNKVVSLAEGVSSYILGEDRGVTIVATPGKPFGTLLGNSFRWSRDDKGNILVDPTTGIPLKTSGKSLYEMGNALPDWIGGFNNAFHYKGFSLTALIDMSHGGLIYSQSLREELNYGNIKKTLPGRDGTFVAEGVVAQKNAEGVWVGTGQVNTKQIRSQDYWNVVAPDKDNMLSEEILNDASYKILREVTFNYQIPSKLMTKTPFKGARVGVYGRNLFYFERHTDGYAPEASSLNVNNSSLGLESTSLPLMRYFGVSFNVDL